MKERLLVHRLRRAGNVAMTLVERVLGFAARPQQLLEGRRKQISCLRGAVSPSIRYTRVLMAEEAQIESIGTIGTQLHDLAHSLNESRPAIRGKPHDLVLVARMRKTEILGDGLVAD